MFSLLKNWRNQMVDYNNASSLLRLNQLPQPGQPMQPGQSMQPGQPMQSIQPIQPIQSMPMYTPNQPILFQQPMPMYINWPQQQMWQQPIRPTTY